MAQKKLKSAEGKKKEELVSLAWGKRGGTDFIQGIFGVIIKEGAPSQILLAPELVKVLLGGKWPNFHGFCFDEVYAYLFEAGELTPVDNLGDEIPGPNFKINLSIPKACKEMFLPPDATPEEQMEIIAS